MPEQLKRDLGLMEVFCIASGAMISSGLFILPGIASAKVGPALFVSYIIASLLAVPTMLSTVELSTAMPRAGGDYFYISRTMGLLVGIIAGLSSWFSLSLKGAFALIGMAAYVEYVLPLPVGWIAAAICLVFVIINLLGIKEAARWQVVMVLGLFAILSGFVIVGFPAIDIKRYLPFAPFGVPPIFAAAGLVFISYGGLTKIVSVAEEVKNPGKNIPLGMILSLILVGILYALVVFITTGLLSPEKLHNSLTPISDAAFAIAGMPAGIIISIAAMLAFISTANAAIMSSSRYPIAMSRDRLLPQFFERINERFKTPHFSIIFTGLFMVMAILFLNLESLVKFASSLLLLLYICANLAVIIMRESKIQNYKPKFYSPFYPVTQIMGILGCCFLLFEMGEQVFYLLTVLTFLGVGWYLLFARLRSKREFALTHIVERVVNKELTTGDLARELKDILRERDNIIEDRFDQVINKAKVLDIEEPLGMEELFKNVSAIVAKDLSMDKDNIFNLLNQREAETSTVLRPGLAIPHIIIEGEKKFEVVMVRCKKGLKFKGADEPVHIVFMLFGTKDERNFHLKSLAAIAQIVQKKGFDKQWLQARDENELRDIILLSERKRHISV
ncbi:MAG: amino acid permease [Candidatus Omnitrophota bacterium]